MFDHVWIIRRSFFFPHIHHSSNLGCGSMLSISWFCGVASIFLQTVDCDTLTPFLWMLLLVSLLFWGFSCNSSCIATVISCGGYLQPICLVSGCWYQWLISFSGQSILLCWLCSGLGQFLFSQNGFMVFMLVPFNNSCCLHTETQSFKQSVDIQSYDSLEKMAGSKENLKKMFLLLYTRQCKYQKIKAELLIEHLILRFGSQIRMSSVYRKGRRIGLAVPVLSEETMWDS